ARSAEAGLRNVSFLQSDIGQIAQRESFDGVVGRLILQFLPDPSAVLRSLWRLVRPGGFLAFQEPTWAPCLQVMAQLPLWTSCAVLIRDTFARSAANPEMGQALFRTFSEAGVPAPTMRLEMAIGGDPF